MRLRIALLPAVVVTLASVGLLAVPSANASTAAKKTPTITCKKFTGNLDGGNGTLSGCSDKANTGGSGTFPPSSVEEASGTATKPFRLGGRLFFLGKDTQEDPFDVAVDDCHRLAEGDASNSRGGVLSYSRELAQFLGGRRQGSVVLPDHHLRCLVHQLGATVISQAAPGGKHSRFLRLG